MAKPNPRAQKIAQFIGRTPPPDQLPAGTDKYGFTQAQRIARRKRNQQSELQWLRRPQGPSWPGHTNKNMVD
jgi:hypothetical protein